jgi:hypothetical protein
VRYLTISTEEIDGKTAAVLTYRPDVPALPAKHMILPPDADAGHVAAMSQYLCGGAPGVCEVSVAPEVRGLLIDGFVTVARKRGVRVDVPDEDHVVMTSDDATTQVEIVFDLTSVNI